MELTTKEKAKELVEKYFEICHKSSDLELSWKVCKKLALIDIQGKIDMLETLHKPEYSIFNSYSDDPINGYEMIEFLEQVKIEINNL